MAEPMPDDPRIKTFIRSGRRRRAVSYAIVGASLLLAGAISMAFGLAYPGDRGDGYVLVVVAGMGLLIGLCLVLVAYRAWTGAIDDLKPISLREVLDPPEPPEPIPKAIARKR